MWFRYFGGIIDEPLSRRCGLLTCGPSCTARLYRYYRHPNQELYALMESLGPTVGWTGRFPTSFRQQQQQMQERRILGETVNGSTPGSVKA